MAAHKLANEAAGQTLQPTALVHEVWLRLSRAPSQALAGPHAFLSHRCPNYATHSD
jgi:hypothetical protein